MLSEETEEKTMERHGQPDLSRVSGPWRWFCGAALGLALLGTLLSSAEGASVRHAYDGAGRLTEIRFVGQGEGGTDRVVRQHYDGDGNVTLFEVVDEGGTPTPAPTASPEPSVTPVPTPTGAPAPSATGAPTASPGPTGTGAPSPTGVAPTDMPVPTGVPPAPTPVVREGSLQGDPRGLLPEELPHAGGASRGDVLISPDIVRQILGSQVLPEAYQLVEVREGQEAVFATGTGFVTLVVTSSVTEEGNVVYRWILVVKNQQTGAWEVATGEVGALGRACPAFEATAQELRTRVADGGPYDKDGRKDATVTLETATVLLGAPREGPSPLPSGSPGSAGGGGCGVGSFPLSSLILLLLVPLGVLKGSK